MKKQMKTLGVVATSAALALGCAVPAFATSPTGSVSTEKETVVGTADGIAGDTKVNLYGYDKNTQIVATIPVELTVAAPQAGGDIIAPTPGTYSIENGGDPSIKVTNVKGSPIDDTKWTLSDAATKPAGNGSSAATAMMWLTVQNGYSAAVPVVYNEDSGTDVTSDFQAAKGGKIELSLAGAAYPAKASSAPAELKTFGTSSIPAVKITYTIAAAE